MKARNLKQILLAVLVLGLLLALVGCQSGAEKPSKQVLLVLREKSDDMEFMLKNEVQVMVDLLEKAGYEVVTASVSGEPIVAGDTTVTPDMKLADVKMADYAGLILPCMGVPLDSDPDPEEIRVAKEAASLGIPIAAQFGGLFVLRDAGVLDGKQIAMLNDFASEFTNSSLKGAGVVQDGKIITSAVCPMLEAMGAGADGTEELTQAFVDMLKAQ